MKQVYKGYIFDTEKSTKICEYEYTQTMDFLFVNPPVVVCKEALYKENETGYYFIINNSYVYSFAADDVGRAILLPHDKLYSVNLYEAKKWGQNHMTDKAYIKEFGVSKETALDLSEERFCAPEIDTFIRGEVDDLELSDI